MQLTDDGLPVQDLIETVKRSIKAANVSRTTDGRDLSIDSVRLTLHALATRAYGGGLNFHIPLIGTEFRLGGKVSRQDLHEIEIIMVPPLPEELPELRDGDLGDVLVEAIETIRETLASAADGDDPFVLAESKITIVFGVTTEGDISIGVDTSLTDETSQTLTLTLVPATELSEPVSRSAVPARCPRHSAGRPRRSRPVPRPVPGPQSFLCVRRVAGENSPVSGPVRRQPQCPLSRSVVQAVTGNREGPAGVGAGLR